MWFRKASARRQAIREDVPASEGRGLLRGGSGYFVVITLVFALVAAAVQFWPGVSVPYREGELAPADLRSPVTFNFVDQGVFRIQQQAARATSPPVLFLDETAANGLRFRFKSLRQDLDGVRAVSQLSPEVRAQNPGLTDKALAELNNYKQEDFAEAARIFVMSELIRVPIVSKEDREILLERGAKEVRTALTNSIEGSLGLANMRQVYVAGEHGVDPLSLDDIKEKAPMFPENLRSFLAQMVITYAKPMFHFDTKLTTQLADRTASGLAPFGPQIQKDEVIVRRGEKIEAQAYQKLLAAQAAFQAELGKEHPWNPWLSRLGYVLTVLILTAAGGLYITRMNQWINSPQRAWSICGLLLVTLVLARAMVAALPPSVYILGIAPTLLTAIILVIAFNQRFAMGVAALHGLLVTITLRQGIDFYLTLMAGSAVFCFGLHEIRTRGKLIEVGVLSSVAIFGTIWALGFSRVIGLAWSPWAGSIDVNAIWVDGLWGLGAGVFVAMFALAILPTVERLFRITTAMTLLELCDANKPLLQRLSQEAPGTFNHSLTVGIMAEAAGNAIGANGLLCRVGAYYHDVGKLSKPQYFIENQTPGSTSRHDKLSPAMSLLIIVGHVKDGIELAREYGLPWVVHQFIAQHHGTTLVEYFYHAARKRAEKADDGPAVSETEFRYPGPKPQSREAAIIMICDSCESVVRSLEEPSPGRIEAAVHTMIMKRLMDGQFSQCDLTLRDLSVIEETLVRTLAGIHHGRIAYPSRGESDTLNISLSQPA